MLPVIDPNMMRAVFCDLYQLREQAEAAAMLRCAAIKVDYGWMSPSQFPRSCFHSGEMRFARSDAVMPHAGLAAVMGRECDAQCHLTLFWFPSATG